jgi:uncharacterized protein (TIGR02172 family)
MEYITYKMDDSRMTVFLKGHIDSANANSVEKEIGEALDRETPDDLIIDAGELTYISSAGLRILLRLRKEMKDLKVINVSPEVYEIFDMTGFTEILNIQKAYRVISVEGCEVIGQGANGKVYRIDPDTIVKVYMNPDSLPEIHRERELARAAFVLGIPTAIPYDVVRVGDGYGSVFELLNATSFAKLIINGEKDPMEVAAMSIDLLKLIHSTVIKPGTMPDMKAVALDWADFLKDYLPEDKWAKLHKLVADVPYDMHMMHGDYHIKNVMLQNGEVLLIDMDTLCHGHPIFELASMFNAYAGYSDVDHSVVKDFIGIPYEVSVPFWRESLRLYLGTDDEDRINEVEEKAKLIGFVRIMRIRIRRNGFDTEEGRKEIENAKAHILELVDKLDTLTF